MCDTSRASLRKRPNTEWSVGASVLKTESVSYQDPFTREIGQLSSFLKSGCIATHIGAQGHGSAGTDIFRQKKNTTKRPHSPEAEAEIENATGNKLDDLVVIMYQISKGSRRIQFGLREAKKVSV